MTTANQSNIKTPCSKHFKKIMLIGCPGSGKTTLARNLHHALNIPLHHLDTIMWQSGWQKKSASWAMHYHTQLCHSASWIIDGNHIPTLAERCLHADLIIFLKIPRWRCMLRIFNRWLLFRNQQRNDLAPGCFDELNHKYLRYAWHFHKHYEPLLSFFAQQSTTKIIELQSTQDINNFLHNIMPR